MNTRIAPLFSHPAPLPIQILIGEGLGDSFFTADGREQDFLAAFHAALREAGYQRIAFIAPHRPVFYLDAESERFASPEGLNPAASAPRPRTGPLRDRQLLTGGVMNVRSNHMPMGDVHAVRLLHALMTDPRPIRTAVVIQQAESWMAFHESQRTLAGLVASWLNLPSNRYSQCYCVFSARNIDALREIAPMLPVPELREIIQSTEPSPSASSVFCLQEPVIEEWDVMLRHLEAARGQTVPEEERSRLLRWISAEGGSLRIWHERLASLPEWSFAAVRAQGWFSSVRRPDLSLEEKLEAVVGRAELKQHLLDFRAWVRLQWSPDRPPQEEAPLLHMVFSGSPGTGKTTFARLVGEILRDAGVLRRGHLVETTPGQMVAQFIGGTAAKTNQIIDSALDGVLFIDEAYGLVEAERGGYGAEALETLLTRMENDRQRLVVIAAGYTQKMHKFLDANPGLSRRFPAENRLVFTDLDPNELAEILSQSLRSRGLSLHPSLESALDECIHGMLREKDEHFGNAGEMRNLADALERAFAVRTAADPLTPALLVPQDLPDHYQRYLQPQVDSVEEVFQELDALTGLENVKRSLRALAYRILMENRRRELDPTYTPTYPKSHFIFTGNPGTGKTTVARLVGRLFRALGLLTQGHMVEVTRADLVAGYVGQTALKTAQKIKEARGGVLFIDEAYTLARGGSQDFGREAVDTLVKALEDESHRLVVIAAGYPEEMQGFLQMNPGLASRFGDPILFPNYTPAELREILAQCAAHDQYKITEDALTQMTVLLTQRAALRSRSFGNARAARSLWEAVKNFHAEKVYTGHDRSTRNDEELGRITAEDIPEDTGPIVGQISMREARSAYNTARECPPERPAHAIKSSPRVKTADTAACLAPDWKAAPIKLSEALGLKPSASTPAFQNTIQSGCGGSGSSQPQPDLQTW